MVDCTQRDRVLLTDNNAFYSSYGEVIVDCVNDVYIELSHDCFHFKRLL